MATCPPAVTASPSAARAPAAVPPGTTAMALASIGITATRWFSNRPRTTTSASASTSSSRPACSPATRFEPSASNCSGRARRERSFRVDDRVEGVVVDDDGLGGVDRRGLAWSRRPPRRRRRRNAPCRARAAGAVHAGLSTISPSYAGGRGRRRRTRRRRRRARPHPMQSIETTRACANGERTKTTWSTPSRSRSSTNVAVPVSSAGSSTRRTSVPRIEPGIAGHYR